MVDGGELRHHPPNQPFDPGSLSGAGARLGPLRVAPHPYYT